MKESLAILICSCDKYEDVWEPFFHFFHKHWSACPWPIYLMTNTKSYDDHRIHTINTGEDSDWSTVFLETVNQINSKYLLILMEDYFLLRPPNERVIGKIAEYMRQNHISYFRLFPRPGPDTITGEIDGVRFGEITEDSEYRVSLQAAIWDTDYIRRLVNPGESAWELEVEGTRRSRQMPDRLFSIAWEEETPIPYLCTAVVKGYWIKEAVQMCRQNNLELDLSQRKVEPFYRRWNIQPLIRLMERNGG